MNGMLIVLARELLKICFTVNNLVEGFSPLLKCIKTLKIHTTDSVHCKDRLKQKTILVHCVYLKTWLWDSLCCR